MKDKFLKPEHDQDVNPVEYFNNHRSWDDVLMNVKTAEELRECIEGEFLIPGEFTSFGLKQGKKYSKFQALSRIRFKGNYTAAITYIEREWLTKELPYIRVGTDYYKEITKADRYGVDRKILKGWNKDEIKNDHGPGLLHRLPRYDDFCILPNNVSNRPMVDRCYNLYAPFSHKPVKRSVSVEDIPESLNLIRHIFRDQYAMGLIYLKVLYQHPCQPLPILSLVSRERQTGKTTFLNWMQMIFGDNFTQINPEDLSSQFNSNYATKNIIALDETVIEKSHAIEKLKSLATAKSLSVNQKFVANYSLPFYGKVILCTNKEKDFMRIDEEEIRFWVRKIRTIAKINTAIEDQLRDEIPALLKYLIDLPEIDFSQSRMVFTATELRTDQLDSIMQASWSSLRKDLNIFFEEYFYQNDNVTEVKATPSDIKKKWFDRDSKISPSYILKVLKDEMQLMQCDLLRYAPFDSDPLVKQRGRPFVFKRSDFIDKVIESELKNVVVT